MASWDDDLTDRAAPPGGRYQLAAVIGLVAALIIFAGLAAAVVAAR